MIIWIAYILLSYPLLYFSYKFCLPDFGGEDYYEYLVLYKNWDFQAVTCPFNMRIVGSFAIFLMNKAGISYETETVFLTVHPAYDQQVFFNAILFNYLCVVSTCYVIYKTVRLFFPNDLFSFLSGGMYLLGFGTLFFSLKPTSEACGILLTSICFFYYIRKRQAIHFIFLISLFQREYIFIVFLIMSLLDYIFYRNKYYIITFLSALLFFLAYYIMRKTIFYTPAWDFQTSIPSLFSSLIELPIVWPTFIKQTLLISNLFWIYLLVLFYKKIHKLPINGNFLIVVMVLLAEVIVMSIMARFGNNAGRYFYYLSPLIIYYIFLELKPLLSLYFNFKENV